MVDEETGADPIARDGDPDDQLAERRARRGGNGEGKAKGRRRATTEKGAGSIAARGADAEPPSDEELFPLGTLSGDPRTTLRSLIKSGLPVEITASLMSAEVPLRGGLLDPEAAGRAVISYEPYRFEVVPRRKEGKVIGWKIRQVLRPTYVESAEDSPAVAAG